MNHSTKIARQLRPTMRAVWKRYAFSFFAVIAGVSVIQQLSDSRAFAADTPVATSSEQTVQQVEKMLLMGLGLPPKDTITKWQNEIRIGLISDNAISVDLLGKFGRYISEAQRASGRSIFIFGKDAGFVVVFSQNTRQDVANHADVLSTFFDNTGTFQKFFGDYENKKQTCAIRMKVGPTDQIYAFLLFLSVSQDRNPKRIDECLRRGTLAGLGVVHAYDEALDPPSERGGLTKLDILSLKVLYHPDLLVGADTEQVSSEIARLIGTLAK